MPRLSASLAALGPLAALLTLAGTSDAGNLLQPGAAKLDRPTLVALGVVLPIAGDDNHDAKVTVRYRVSGTGTFRDAMPLYRVHPEVVAGDSPGEQFAGSVFDLLPATSYDLELHVVDPDGLDTTTMLQATTRGVPKDPMVAKGKMVTDATTLKQALAGAVAGDVITLAPGTYAGQFSISASGTASDPIVIRGASQSAVVLDGQGCTGCNVVEIYGSYVHVEDLTIKSAERAIRFQGAGTQGNVVRRVHATDVTLAIGSKADQLDYYLCDNVFEGRLAWPLTYGDDGAAHASDDGIVIQGSGHVVCHNVISGFADALQNAGHAARALDFYGNDVLWTYDDGIELDESEGNVRCFRNRFSNTYDTLSYQPVFGGPAYTFRNVIVNVANEGMKLHALGGNPPQQPVGVYVFHNTFVRPYHAIQVSTPDAVHYYSVENNLFVTSAAPTNGVTVAWDTPIDSATGLIDYNGYFPEGMFELGYGATGATYPSFAAVQAAGKYEKHGVLLGGAIFASGLAATSDHKALVAPANAALASGSGAIDKGVVLPNLNDGFTGAAPDLGALELGCPAPIFGVRPAGTDESNAPTGCVGGGGAGGAGGGGVSGSSGQAGKGAAAGSGAGGGGAGKGGAAGAGTAGSISSAGTSGSVGGATGSAGKGGAAGKAASGGANASGGKGGASASGAAPGAAPAASDSSGGCGCRTASAPATPFGAFALLGLALLRRRAKSEARR